MRSPAKFVLYSTLLWLPAVSAALILCAIYVPGMKIPGEITGWICLFYAQLRINGRRRQWLTCGPDRYMTSKGQTLAVIGQALLVLSALSFAGQFFTISILLLFSSLISLIFQAYWLKLEYLSRFMMNLLPEQFPEQGAGGISDFLWVVHKEQDIVDAVQAAIASGCKLRPAGSRCSSNLYRETEHPGKDIQLDMEHYNQVIAYEPDKKTIHVQAGMLQGTLVDLLKEHGLALPALNGSNKLSIGGTIATGSICGSRYLLSDHVTALTVVDGKGNVTRVSRESDPDTFGAYLCSLGLLGVISSIEFNLVGEFSVTGAVINTGFDELLELGNENVLSQLDYVISDWYPDTNTVLSRQYRKQEGHIPDDEKKLQSAMTPTESIIAQLFTSLVNIVPVMKKPVLRLFTALFYAGETRGSWYDLIVVDLAYHPIEYTEIVIPQNRYREFMLELKQHYDDHPENIPFAPVITDWIAGDPNSWIAKNSVRQPGREMFAAITLSHQAIEKNFSPGRFDAAIQLAQKYNARMHWGKYPWIQDRQTLTKSLPEGNVQRFCELRSIQDPRGVFFIPLFKKLFN